MPAMPVLSIIRQSLICRVGLRGKASLAALLCACLGLWPAIVPAADPSHNFTPAALEWHPCDPLGYQCANLQVPLDYNQPAGELLTLALKRRPSNAPERKIGTVFIEPGGPGGSGVQSVPFFASMLSKDVLDYFDIVGFDPRGVGQSQALGCSANITFYFGNDLASINDPATDQAARDYARGCANDPVLAQMGTLNVVRDLDVLRRAVGDDKLTYFGVSYGTEVGIVYADMFPDKVRAMIIDGVVNPAQSGRDILINQAVVWNEALENFFKWCAARANCEIGPDPRLRFQDVLESARNKPAMAELNGRSFAISTGWVTLASVLAVYDPQGYDGLARNLANALKGDWTAYQQGLPAFGASGAPAAAVWVTCMDQPLADGPEFESLVKEAAARAPMTGAVAANINRPCAYLPVPPTPVPGNYAAKGSPTIMVWGTTGDPATPYISSVQVARQLSNAALFTLEADVHTAMGHNECVIREQSDYLLTGQVSDGKRVC